MINWEGYMESRCTLPIFLPASLFLLPCSWPAGERTYLRVLGLREVLLQVSSFFLSCWNHWSHLPGTHDELSPFLAFMVLVLWSLYLLPAFQEFNWPLGSLLLFPITLHTLKTCSPKAKLSQELQLEVNSSFYSISVISFPFSLYHLLLLINSLLQLPLEHLLTNSSRASLS